MRKADFKICIFNIQMQNILNLLKQPRILEVRRIYKLLEEDSLSQVPNSEKKKEAWRRLCEELVGVANTRDRRLVEKHMAKLNKLWLVGFKKEKIV